VVTLTARSSDVTTVVVVDDDGITYPVTPNTNATITVEGSPGDQKRFRLRANVQTDLGDEVTVSWACAAGTYVDDQMACRSVLRYENIVIGDANLAPNTRIFKGDSCAEVAEKVVWTRNATPYQISPTNPRPLGQRGYYKTPLPNGLIPMFGAIFEKNDVREGLMLNPVTETVEVYDGSGGPLPPFGPTQADVDPGWISVSEYSTDPTIGTFAETSVWMIYSPYDKPMEVYCRDLATGVSILLPGTDNDIQYRNFTAYRN
jgi:hypothetical protein